MDDRIRVLVVDDEEVVRLSYRRVLRTALVMAAGDGDEALNLIGGHFDVVLLDMRMPAWTA
jgi:CheY-like chemotaxis protein